jgi:hypothetical protein
MCGLIDILYTYEGKIYFLSQEELDTIKVRNDKKDG